MSVKLVAMRGRLFLDADLFLFQCDVADDDVEEKFALINRFVGNQRQILLLYLGE